VTSLRVRWLAPTYTNPLDTPWGVINSFGFCLIIVETIEALLQYFVVQLRFKKGGKCMIDPAIWLKTSSLEKERLDLSE